MPRILIRHLLVVAVGVALFTLIVWLAGALVPETLGQLLGFIVVMSLILEFWGETLGRLALRYGAFWGFAVTLVIFLALSFLRPFALVVHDLRMVLVLCSGFALIALLPAWLHQWEEGAEEQDKSDRRYSAAAVLAVQEYCDGYDLAEPASLNALIDSIRRVQADLVHVGAWLGDTFVFGRIGFDPARGDDPFVIGSVDNPVIANPLRTQELNERFRARLAELS